MFSVDCSLHRRKIRFEFFIMKRSVESFFIADPISFIASGTIFYCKSVLLYCETGERGGGRYYTDSGK